MNNKKLSTGFGVVDMALLTSSPNPLGLGVCELQTDAEDISAANKPIHFTCYIPSAAKPDFWFRFDLAGNHFKEGNEHLPKNFDSYLKAVKVWLREKPITRERFSSLMPTNLEWVVNTWYNQNPQYERYDLDDLLDSDNRATPFLLSLIEKGEI